MSVTRYCETTTFTPASSHMRPQCKHFHGWYRYSPLCKGLPRFAAVADDCYFKMPTSCLSSVDINTNKNSLLTFFNAEHT